MKKVLIIGLFLCVSAGFAADVDAVYTRQGYTTLYAVKDELNDLAEGGTLTNGLTIGAGGLTVTAGGQTVTAGGLTITAGGLTVTAGDTSLGADLSVAGDASVGTNLTVDGDIELGNATDTTLSRSGSGDVTIEGNAVYRAGGTALPVSDASAALKTKVCIKDIAGFNADQEEYIFVAPVDCTIASVGIVTDTATTGSDATNYWTFVVANLTASTELTASAYDTDLAGDVTADTLTSLLVDQNLSLTAGDVLELQITKAGAPTDLTSAEIISVVEWY